MPVMGRKFLEKCFASSPTMVFRKIGDECFVVPLRKNMADLQSLYVLNETAGRIWELLDGKRKLKEVREIILAEFDADPREIEADLELFLQQLQAIGALVEVA